MRGRVAVLAAVLGLVPMGTAAAEEMYDQYSLLYNRSAGQLEDVAGTPTSQWAWKPGSDGESAIRWAVPAEWDTPADGVEHFVRDGDWLYLDGYENQSTGTYNPQRVLSEQLGKGLGMGLAIHATVADGAPIDWRADLRHVWTWT